MAWLKSIVLNFYYSAILLMTCDFIHGYRTHIRGRTTLHVPLQSSPASAIISKADFYRHLGGFNIQADSDEFGALLTSSAQSKDVVLTNDGKRSLLAEIVRRYRDLDSSSMAKCLWLIGKMNFSHDDAAISVIIDDIINSLAQLSSTLMDDKKVSTNEVTANSIAGLLICHA